MESQLIAPAALNKTDARLDSPFVRNMLLFFFFCFQSGLNITSQLSVFTFVGALLLGVFILFNLFSPYSFFIQDSDKTRRLLYLFLIIVFYTMLIRGIGFEALGGGKSGGMFYVKLFLVLLLYLFIVRLKVFDDFIRQLFVLFCISGILPFISDLVYLSFGEATWFNSLITGSSTIEFYAQNEANSLLRIQSATAVAESIGLLVLVFFPVFNQKGGINLTFINVSLIVLALLLIGISGHRITLVGLTLLFLIAYYFSFGGKKLVRPILIGIALAIFFASLIIWQYEQLPANFQRTFSFLPFIPQTNITLEASDSANFRLFMAAKALVMLPDYYLIGKGFAFANYTVAFDDYFGIIDFFAEIGVFHNGLLGLLINLGIPGLIIGVLLMLSVLKENKIKKNYFSEELIYRIRMVLKAKLIVIVIYFFVLYGDVQTNFIDFIVIATLYKFISGVTAIKSV